MKPIYIVGVIILTLIFGEEVQASSTQKVNVIFIGNSITESSYLDNPPPSVAAKYLKSYGYEVKFANCGVSGSTTVDFLPSSNRCYLKVVAAADTLYKEEGYLIFSITLGTNDSAEKGPSGSPVAPLQYKENLQIIIDSLQQRYPQSKFVLNRPTWYSPNTHNSALYMQEGLTRLQSYTPQMEALIKENSDRVYKGDWSAFDFFRKNYLNYFKPQKGNSGIFYLHPNAKGSEKLGEFWAKGLNKNISKWTKSKNN